MPGARPSPACPPHDRAATAETLVAAVGSGALRAGVHPDSEPRGEAENGSPCPWCGDPDWYQRAHVGAPMRWVHRDETPRCTEPIAVLRAAIAHLSTAAATDRAPVMLR